MKHFSITEWADFVRDLTTGEQTAQMREHLDEGCGGCTETVQTWRSVAEYARAEASYEPPSSSLPIAKSYFAPFKAASSQVTGTRVARLCFDSFARGLQVGVRGSDPLPHQLMYEYDDLVIDLSLDRRVASDELLLIGQIAHSGQARGSQEGIPVSLLSGNNTLLKTSASQSGEFHFAFRPSKHLHVSVGLNDTAVLLSLPEAEA